jgi:tetratricopeptide (TPR) repeat protein
MASFGLIWILITLTPVLNAKWVGLNAFTERYLYLPSIGFCWVLGVGLIHLWAVIRRHAVLRRCFIGAVMLLMTLCIIRIITRNRDWRDNIGLYTRTLTLSPDATLIRINLGTVYKNQGLLTEAENEFRQALQGDPECAECLNDIAWIFLEQSRYAEAKNLLVRSIRLDSNAVYSHLNLGIVYWHTGLVEHAAQEFGEALKLGPRDVRVYRTLGSFYERYGDRSRAEDALKRALWIDPYDAQVHLALGNLYVANKRTAESIQEFQAALENDPGCLDALVALRKLKSEIQ